MIHLSVYSVCGFESSKFTVNNSPHFSRTATTTLFLNQKVALSQKTVVVAVVVTVYLTAANFTAAGLDVN